MRPLRFVVFVVLAVLVLPLPCHSQTRILIVSQSGPGADRLSAVVERCAAMALAGAGFEPVIAAGAGAERASASLLLELSLKAWGYDLVLSILGGGGDTLAEGRLGGELGLDLDEAVILEVTRLVAVTGLEPRPFALAEPEASAPPAQSLPEAETDLPPPLPPSPPPILVAAAAPASSASPEPLPDAGTNPPPLRPSQPSAPVGIAAGRRFDASFSTAPFFVVGPATEFFRFGFDTGAYAGATLLSGGFSLDVGGRLGYALVFPAGSVGGQVHLVSLGFELRGSLSGRGPISAYARLGAGPLLVAAVASGSGSQGKVLPFCHAGLGFELRPSATLSIGLDLGLLAVLERSLPLIGLTPGLRLSFRP